MYVQYSICMDCVYILYVHMFIRMCIGVIVVCILTICTHVRLNFLVRSVNFFVVFQALVQ